MIQTVLLVNDISTVRQCINDYTMMIATKIDKENPKTQTIFAVLTKVRFFLLFRPNLTDPEKDTYPEGTVDFYGSRSGSDQSK